MKKALETWKPSDLYDKRRKIPTSEKGWEESLLKHLRTSLRDIQIIPQAGAGMVRGDIVIERKTILGGIVRDTIELKLGMNSTAAYQRLLGQIQTYTKERGWTFVVICGQDVDPELVKASKDHYKGVVPRLGIFLKKNEHKGAEVIVQSAPHLASKDEQCQMRAISVPRPARHSAMPCEFLRAQGQSNVRSPVPRSLA